MYRSQSQSSLYRVIPLAEAPIELRHAVEAAIGRPRQQGLAPILEAAQAVGRGFFYVRYEAPLALTLFEVLEDTDAARRLTHAAQALGALATWWQTVGGGVLPLPAEIVFVAGQAPVLLHLPLGGPLVPEVVLEEPARALHLAPEVVCGRAPLSEATDRYALGVALQQCFTRPTPAGAEEILWRAANSTLFADERLNTRLPFWQEALLAEQGVLQQVRRLLDPDPAARGAEDPGLLAAALVQHAKRMDGLAAVQELTMQGRKADALALARDVLMTHVSPQLLRAAAALAAEVGQALEAVDLYERALGLEPARGQTYAEQFEVVAQIVNAGPLAEMIALWRAESPGGRRFDVLFWRDYHRLERRTQDAHAGTVARYLLNRDQYAAAHQFLHPLIYPDTWHWWERALNLMLTEALVGEGLLEEAMRHLREIKVRLTQARANRAYPAPDAAVYSMAIAALEAEIERRRAPGGRR